MQVTIEIPESFEIESRDATVIAKPTEFVTEILAKIFTYGLSSVATDAANGAPRAAAIDAIGQKGDKEKPESYEKKLKDWIKAPENKDAITAKTESLMQARLDNFAAGKWSVRGTGGMSRTERIRDTIVRASAKALLGADWAKFEALDDNEQAAKVASWYEGNKAAFDAAVAERIAKLDAEKERRNSLNNAVAISL